MYTARTRLSTWPCTRPVTVRIRPCTPTHTYTAAYTTFYTCTGRVHNLYTAVHTVVAHGRVHGRAPIHGRVHGHIYGQGHEYIRTRPVYTAVCTVARTRLYIRAVSVAVYGTAVYRHTTVYTGSVLGRVQGRVHGNVHGLYTAVYRARAVYIACIRPCTRSCRRIHGPYTKPIEFATFSQTVVITSVNKAEHHIACHRKFIKDLG